MSNTLQLGAADSLLVTMGKSKLQQGIHQVKRGISHNEDEKNQILNYCVQEPGSLSEMKVCIPTFKGFLVIRLGDIIVCEAEKNYTIIHLQNKKSLTVSRPLLEYERILSGTCFLRVHRTYLINVHHVKEYQRGEGGVVIMSNGAAIEISRRKKEGFLSSMKQIFRS